MIEQLPKDLQTVLGNELQLYECSVHSFEESARNRVYFTLCLTFDGQHDIIDEETDEEVVVWPTVIYNIPLIYEGGCKFLYKVSQRENILLTKESVYKMMCLSKLIEE